MKQVNIGMDIKLRGRFKLQVVDENGIITKEIPWFDNLITNQGLDQIGGYQPAYNVGGHYLNITCSVGTNNTTPTDTDTQMGTFLAAAPALGGGVTGTALAYNSGVTPYWSSIWTYTFSAGVATGTLAEIGVGNWTSASDTQPWLFSHALITSGGTPTTITVLSSESLIVTYELDYYINTTTNSYSFVMSTVTYSGNYLRSRIATAPSLNLACINGLFGNNTPYLYIYNGSISAATGFPSGSQVGGPNGCSTVSGGAYTNGSYYNTFQTNFSISQGNVSGGITAFEILTSSAGSWQFSVSPTIPKTSSYQISLTYAVSWARYP